MAFRLLPALLLALLALPAGRPAATEAPACPAAPIQPLRLPRLVATAGAPPVIVALGSSSTEGAGASSPAAAYPPQLEAALARQGLAARVVNRGRGGEEVAEMLSRLEADVLTHRPAVVIWQVGVNGAIRSHPLDRFVLLLREGVRAMQEAGADVVLLDSQGGPWARRAPMRDAFDAALADMAVEKGVALFSRHRLMDTWASAGAAPEGMLVSDGLHHNDRGYACLAEAMARGIRAGLPDR